MSSLQEVLEQVNESLKKPIDKKAVFEAWAKVHSELTDPKWAIEDPLVREELEQLVINYATNAYFDRLAALPHQQLNTPPKQQLNTKGSKKGG